MKKSGECRTFVIAGHSGSGKTSLADLMLFKSGAVSRLGSVDQKTSVGDYMPDEQEKHSSIYSSVMNCPWQDHHFFFIDTPGYGEFTGQCFGAMRAADAALVVLDAVDGPQVGTARAWKLARINEIPRFGFINRLDRERADFKGTLEKMRANHGKNVVIPLTIPVGSGEKLERVVNVLFDEIPPELAADAEEYRSLWLDAIAETDEDLMMRYLDGETLTPEEIARGLRKAILACKVIPVFSGSVARDIGITELMDGIIKWFPTPLDKGTVLTADGTLEQLTETGPGRVLVFKSINDPTVGQLTFLRVRSGVLTGDCEVYNIRNGGRERLGNLLLINGKSQTGVDSACPGMLVAVAKLKDTHIGDTLGMDQNVKLLRPIVFPNPVMSYAVSTVRSGDDDKLAVGLGKIAECDPTVRLQRDEETHELLLSGMGDQHLANVVRRLRDFYKVEATLSTPKVPYRETITAVGEGHYRHKKQTGGAGQFAEVMLKIEPNEAGYEFVNAVVGGAIPKNFIPAVEKGVLESLSAGPLVGCQVERVKVTVLDGKYHPVDSNEMAFKIAARMAFRDAMSKARPVLLEPIMTVHVHIPDSDMGTITGDLNHKRGRILGMSVEEGMEVVNAEVPAAEMAKYATELRSMTQGRGSFELEFARYEQVPPNVAAEVIARHQAEQGEEKE